MINNSSNNSSRLIAKYPFLSNAADYLKVLNYSLEEFNDPSLANIIDKASKRVLAAINGIVYDELEDADIEIVSFLLACIMVRATKVKNLYKRFALAEAKRAEMFLMQDLSKDSKITIDNILRVIFKDLFNVDVIYDKDNALFKIRVEDYLRYATNFHDSYWRLVNRIVHKGYVHLNSRDVIRLIRDELMLIIASKIEGMNIDEGRLPEQIAKYVNAFRAMVYENKEFSVFRIDKGKYPPCIVNILNILEQGGNPSHTARVLLATYMLAIGNSVDEVCELFKNAPDYNANITRYQVEHLAGLRGNMVRYACPSCEKVMLQGLCYKSKECEGIKNPVQFTIKGRYEQRDG